MTAGKLGHLNFRDLRAIDISREPRIRVISSLVALFVPNTFNIPAAGIANTNVFDQPSPPEMFEPFLCLFLGCIVALMVRNFQKIAHRAIHLLTGRFIESAQ